MNVIRSFLSHARTSYKNKEVNFFVHIPKTAGTSFRNSLESNESVLSDYGDARPQTSEAIQQAVYQNSDLYSLKQSLKASSTWLCGHVWLNKYSTIVSVENIATIVRDPVDRVLSHYAHEVRWGQNRSMTLDAFLKTPYANNTQSRFLSGLPVSLIGAVGITEDYEDSLKVINHQFGMNLVTSHDNANEKKACLKQSLTNDIIDRISKQNQEDMQLYIEAKQQQKERLAFLKSNKIWTFMYAKINERNEVKGIIYRKKNEEPIAFRIKQGCNTLHEGIASDYVSEFPDISFTRGRFIGFTFKLPLKQPNSFEPLQLECVDTLQKFQILSTSAV